MEYIIIVEADNSLYGSQKRRIMQREKLFNTLWFLAPQYYNGYDMSQCTVTMRYLLPISREFKTETLVLSNEKYKDEYLKYILPIDTCLTKEFGDIELNLTFTMLDVDDNGNIVQRVRKTDNHLLKITPIPDWDSVIPDSALSALDERIIKLDAQMKALDERNKVIADTKADNIKYNTDTNELQLTSNGSAIGDKVTINVSDASLEDGIPVVDFSSTSNSGNSTDEDEENNVVEF